MPAPSSARRAARGAAARIALAATDDGAVAMRAPRVARCCRDRMPRASCASRRSTGTRFAADVDACTACGLCRTRNKTVPGVGDVRADWLFVGEAPGAEEDARGEPFVGQAGQLSTTCWRRWASTRGSNVYIANVLKCRPPNNRTPEPREVGRVPALPRPPDRAASGRKVIVALGKSAATTLLGIDATIASLRGRVHRYRACRWSSPIIPRICCATCPTRRRPGRISCSRGARCAASAVRRVVERMSTAARRPLHCVAIGPHSSAARRDRGADVFRPEESMIRKLAVLLAVARGARRSRAAATTTCSGRTKASRRVVGGAEPVPAPRRPRAEPRQHGQGLCRAGREGADRSDQRARERRRHQGHAGAHQRSRPRSRSSSEAQGELRARCRGCWSSPRTIRTSSPTRCSATCSRSSRARRTGSPSRATATSRACRSTTRRCASSRPT